MSILAPAGLDIRGPALPTRVNDRQLKDNVRKLGHLDAKYTRLEQRLEALEENSQTNARAQ